MQVGYLFLDISSGRPMYLMQTKLGFAFTPNRSEAVILPKIVEMDSLFAPEQIYNFQQ